MTEFAKKLKASGLTLAEFCRLTSTPYQTAKQWKMDSNKKGARPAPGIAIAWLNLYIKTTEK